MSELTLVCRVCGLEFGFPEEAALHECPACGTQHSRPRARGNTLESLKRANYQRAACDFVNAEQDYRRVLFDHPDEHEALWGLVLCKYGVEYVEDEKTRVRRPVVHFLRRKPITEDADFRLAVARAPEDVRACYLADAEYIGRIQQGVIDAQINSKPCDIFLCYKASLPGSRHGKTRDFGYARDLYFRLSMEDYNVFFAHESLANVAGANYEAQIFYALQSAKVMLVVCSDPAYLLTSWVHSEWSRFLERVDAAQDCRLVPLLYDGCSAYSLPDPFITRSLQCLRMGELTSLDSLRSILSTQLGPRSSDIGEIPLPGKPDQDSQRALLRINMALEDGDWKKAEALAQELIDDAPDVPQSHLSLLLARRQCATSDGLRTCLEPFETDVLWKRALQFADPQTRGMLTGILNDSLSLRKRLKNEKELHRLVQAGEWDKAQHISDELSTDGVTNFSTLLDQLLLTYRLHTMEELASCPAPFEEDDRWQPLLDTANADTRRALQILLARSQQLRLLQASAARARELLQAKNWPDALELTEMLTRKLPHNSEYWLLHLMATASLPNEEALVQSPEHFENTPLWTALISNATPEEQTRYYNLSHQHQLYLQSESGRIAAEAAETKRLQKEQAQREALQKQREAEEEARLAAARGRIIFHRAKEWPFNGPVLYLYDQETNKPLGTLAANSSLEIRIPQDCMVVIRSSTDIDLHSIPACADRITTVDVTWPFLGGVRFAIRSSDPV